MDSFILASVAESNTTREVVMFIVMFIMFCVILIQAMTVSFRNDDIKELNEKNQKLRDKLKVKHNASILISKESEDF